MAYLDFMSPLHRSTSRDYLARVNNQKYPKPQAAELAKKFDFDYWDGDREICYGGYKYMPGRWDKVLKKMIDAYNLDKNSKVLDIGCGKGFMLFDLTKIIPGIEVHGLDISNYAIQNSPIEIRDRLTQGNATKLPFESNYFDLAISINTLHCLECYDLESALMEIERVGKKHKYICVESYRNEKEKANLLYWQVTCEAFNSPKEWEWWFRHTCYTGDHSFIYFE